jgi:hypothetical protein
MYALRRLRSERPAFLVRLSQMFLATSDTPPGDNRSQELKKPLFVPKTLSEKQKQDESPLFGTGYEKSQYKSQYHQQRRGDEA